MKGSKKDPFPWRGRINKWSVALRKDPNKDPSRPHAGTIIDLPKGTGVLVLDWHRGWFKVNVQLAGQHYTGYVSQELVTYVEPATSADDLLQAGQKLPSLDEALVTLKAAETARMKQGPAYRPPLKEQQKITLAITVIQKTGKYEVSSDTYAVSFHEKPGTKLKIETIEDFILFVQAVEKQYPSSSPKEIVSEIRQLWYSDSNWEILVASDGVSMTGDKGKKQPVDIETEPNPIAQRFDMKDLAPAAGSKQLDTAMGKVDIGHVMAGIDAQLSQFPTSYPQEHLKTHGHDDGDSKFKYKTLKEASQGDSRDFSTWAGDLGQAYAEYMVARYVKEEKGANLPAFTKDKATDPELLGDIHGYIAEHVWRQVPVADRPTGDDSKVSNVLLAMYLLRKKPSSPASGTYRKYVEEVSEKKGDALAPFVKERALRFARPWFAKKAVDHRGKWGSKGWSKSGILENGTKEFDERHAQNEKEAGETDKLQSLVDKLMPMMEGSVK